MEKKVENVKDQGAKPLVLVIEDNPDVGELLRYRLEQRGYAVRLMQRGHAFLRALQEQRPDLVVLDLMLPDVAGTQICRTIKSTAKYAEIPVVILTARGDEARLEAAQAGADLFLKKSGFLKGIDAAVRQFCPVDVPVAA